MTPHGGRQRLAHDTECALGTLLAQRGDAAGAMRHAPWGLAGLLAQA